jgi:hypothetical protein
MGGVTMSLDCSDCQWLQDETFEYCLQGHHRAFFKGFRIPIPDCHAWKEKDLPIFKDGAKVRIRNEARIEQDMGFCTWIDHGEIFTVHAFNNSRKKLVAPKYGLQDNYGNGAVYANIEDLIEVKGECVCEITPFHCVIPSFFDLTCKKCGKKVE